MVARWQTKGPRQGAFMAGVHPPFQSTRREHNAGARKGFRARTRPERINQVITFRGDVRKIRSLASVLEKPRLLAEGVSVNPYGNYWHFSNRSRPSYGSRYGRRNGTVASTILISCDSDPSLKLRAGLVETFWRRRLHATYARHMPLLPAKKRRNDMTDDPRQDLEKARAALVAKRLTWVKTIATPGEIPGGAISAIIEVQQAIDVIDHAMEELEEADEMEDDEE
jgi:hypothetical protein